MNTETYQIGHFTGEFIKILIDFSPRLVSAILIFFVGSWAIKLFNKLFQRILAKREIEITLSRFLEDIITWALRILLFITVASRLGIETSSFVAVLGAIGLAVGLSLQGSLSNFAGGVLIVLFKPFKVGDYIRAQGEEGTVLEIQIFVTKLATSNNQIVFIPNGSLSNGTITNFSIENIRRAEIDLNVAYDADLAKTKDTILNVLNTNPLVLTEPKAVVEIKDFNESGVRLSIRPWSNSSDFGTMKSEVLMAIKEKMLENNLQTQPYILQSNKN
jgi:small conductance mechanosensitive channel